MIPIRSFKLKQLHKKTPTLFIRGSVTSSSVIENVNGFHAPNDVKLYAQKIMDIFANDTLYQEVSKNAFEQIYQSWDNIVENVEKRFLEIVEKSVMKKDSTHNRCNIRHRLCIIGKIR